VEERPVGPFVRNHTSSVKDGNENNIFRGSRLKLAHFRIGPDYFCEARKRPAIN